MCESERAGERGIQREERETEEREGVCLRERVRERDFVDSAPRNCRRVVKMRTSDAHVGV